MGQKLPHTRLALVPRPPAGQACNPDLSRVATQHLAAMFAAEPELISACLSGAENKPPMWVGTILAAAEDALAEHPEYADLYYHAGEAAVAAGEYDRAARLLEHALAINAGYHEAQVLAARVALQRRRPHEARAYLETAITQGADYPDVYLLLGTVWRECGDGSRARRAFEHALELNAGLTEARAALAALPSAETPRGAV